MYFADRPHPRDEQAVDRRRVGGDGLGLIEIPRDEHDVAAADEFAATLAQAAAARRNAAGAVQGDDRRAFAFFER